MGVRWLWNNAVDDYRYPMVGGSCEKQSTENADEKKKKNGSENYSYTHFKNNVKICPDLLIWTFSSI